MNRTFLKEGAARVVFALAAALSILAVGLICVFLFANGVPAMVEIGIPDFLLGTTWRPANDIYGIFPMIIGSHLCNGGCAHLRRSCGPSDRDLPLAVRFGEGRGALEAWR